MQEHERHLLALILAGMGALADAAEPPRSTSPAGKPSQTAIGGTLQLGGLVVAIAACGDKDDDTGEEDDDDNTPTVVEGRPFTIEDRARSAPPALRSDWLTPAHIDVSELSAADRRRLTRHFLRTAAGEHASVASFHRVALELIHLGAPPDLLLATQQAAADEIVHAQLAYGMAARASGRTRGPGALDITGALNVDLSPAGVMARLVDEACIEETVSAVCLRVASDRASDPVMSTLLLRIAKDEENHTALGWRTLRWLLDTHPELLPAARQRIEDAFADDEVQVEDDIDLLEHWGLLQPSTRARARHRAFMEVILPATAVLAQRR